MAFTWQKDINGKYSILVGPKDDDIGFIKMIDLLIKSWAECGKCVKLQRGKYEVTILIEPVEED